MTKLVRALLLATALALPVTTLAPVVTGPTVAEAAGKKKMKRTAKVAKVTRVKKAKKTRKAKAKRAKVAGYKSCGTFMYRKGGKCLDARLKK